MRSRQGNGSVFVNVNLPSGEIEGVIVQPNQTVAQVKESIIKQCPTLFAFDKDTLAISINKDEPLTDVNAVFASHPLIKQQLDQQLIIELEIYPVTGDNIKPIVIDSPLESPKSDTEVNTNETKNHRKSYRQSAMFFSTPDLIRESYLFMKQKKKRGKYDKRYFCVTEDYQLLIYKDEHEKTPLETILLSICSVSLVEGRKDIFELSYDKKTIKIHSPDVREITDWFHFFVNSLHYAQKQVSSDPAVDMEGFLNIKEERAFSSLKMRWCVLKYNRLMQYKSQMTARLEQDKPEEVISLDDCLIRSAEQYQQGTSNSLYFYLVTPAKIFVLYCKNGEELRNWIVAMNSSRKKFRLQQSSLGNELPNKAGGSPVAERVEFTKINWAGCKTFQRKILQLSGQGDSILAPEVDQIVDSRVIFKMIGDQGQHFKYFMSRIRSRVLRTKHLQGLQRLDVPLATTTQALLPVAFPAMLTVHFRFAETKIFLESNLRSKALNCPVDTRLDAAVETLLTKAKVSAASKKDIFDSYVIKICGRREFIVDLSIQIKDLVFVRENIKRRRKVELSLVEKSKLIQSILNNEKKYSSYFPDEPMTLVENPRWDLNELSVASPKKPVAGASPKRAPLRPDHNGEIVNVLYTGSNVSTNPLFEGKDRTVTWNKPSNDNVRRAYKPNQNDRKISYSAHKNTSYNHYHRAPVKYVPKGTNAKTAVSHTPVNNSSTAKSPNVSPVPPLNFNQNGSSPSKNRGRKTDWAGATKPLQESPKGELSPLSSPRNSTVGAHRSPILARKNDLSQSDPTTSKSTKSNGSGIVSKYVKSFTEVAQRLSADLNSQVSRLSKQLTNISAKNSPHNSMTLKDMQKNSQESLQISPVDHSGSKANNTNTNNNNNRSPRQKQVNYVPKQQPNTETFPNKEIVSPRAQHANKSLESALEVVQQCIDVATVDKPFEVMILNLESFNQKLLAQYFDSDDTPDARYMCSVELALYYGGSLIETPIRTTEKLSPYWNQILQTKTKLCNLPRETRLGLTVYCSNGKAEVPIGWVNHVVTEHTGRVKSGSFVLKLWERDKAKSTGNCDVNVRSPLALKIQFEESPSPLVYTSAVAFTETMLNFNADDHVIHTPRQNHVVEEPEEQTRHKLRTILKQDALVELSDEDKSLIWNHRDYCRSIDENSLAKVCLACDWSNKDHVAELHALLKIWQPIDPINALELLDFKFSDTLVREFAVKSIKRLGDDELYQYLLQLVQVLKHEPFHLSALAMFLIERALKNPSLIAHGLFWHLQAEMENPELEAKYGLLIWFLIAALPGSQRALLIDQVTLVNVLAGIHSSVFEAPPQSRNELLRKKLTEMSASLPASFALPISSSMVCSGLAIDRCRVLHSATVPLWLVFENEDSSAEPIQVIFKCGDDMRQDVLTLQMFAIMDRLWKEAGMDLQMTLYRCVATGWQTGMLEAVLNADTTAKIQKEAGGVTGAFNKKSITNWLEKHNSEARLYSECVENFVVSCAAYCVATYVIGIGDRHNDNIMVCKSGQLFHIDFAHFLGNIMKFGVYKREKAPFVLTPDFVYVMGGEKSSNYARFIKLCQDAYCILRKRANTFTNLFVMMLLTGIPQLRELQDVTYLKKAFSLAESEDEARVTFARLIVESLNTKTTQINFALHILANPN